MNTYPFADSSFELFIHNLTLEDKTRVREVYQSEGFNKAFELAKQLKQQTKPENSI